MKHSLLISALVVILFSCKKEITQNSNNNSLLTKIKIQLKDSINENDFPGARDSNNFSLAIPLHNRMDEKDYKYVIRQFANI